METQQFSIDIGGKKLIVEFPTWAELAGGSCLARIGDTAVLAVVTMGSARDGISYFPLTVNYDEKFYAAGRILGSRFVRRETRPTEEATLVARVIDRSIRPLFDRRLRKEVQVVAMALSIDKENDPDMVALIASTLALGISDVPWAGPISGVRVAEIDGELAVNPTFDEREKANFEIVVCGRHGNINMIETSASEVPREKLLTAFERAVLENNKLNEFQQNIIAKLGKTKKIIEAPQPPSGLQELFDREIKPQLERALYQESKSTFDEAVGACAEKWQTLVAEQFADVASGVVEDIFSNVVQDIIHVNILQHNKRPDGRSTDELRALHAQTGIFPRLHGSGLFYRGQTHMLSIVTLGSPKDALLIEGMKIREEKRFMHHYNFPPFSVGETGPMRGPSRRDIGHGALAGKALEPIIPSLEKFPYTIRIVSETLSSNGSTSMAATTASCMALMDAGVPIERPVAGIAMGLMMGGGSYKILTDLQGPEDSYGDMDCKIAGSEKGITAMQMDVKIEGITVQMLGEVIKQAELAIEKILKVMHGAIDGPRKTMSQYAPRIYRMQIKPERIGDVIGSGGRTINGIIAETKTEIDIQDDGVVYISGETDEAVQQAVKIVEALTHDVEIGEEFTGKVSRIFDFGAMVEYLPKQEGLVHISQLAPFRVERVEDVVSVGDEVPVRVTGIDEKGRINLSIKEMTSLPLKPGRSQGAPGSSSGDRPHKPHKSPHRRPPRR